MSLLRSMLLGVAFVLMAYAVAALLGMAVSALVDAFMWGWEL